MAATDVAPSRLVAAKRAAIAFLDKVPARVNVGVMAFNSTPSVLLSPSTERGDARAAVMSMKAGGGTASGSAIAAALTVLRPRGAVGALAKRPAAMVLLSDGSSTSGADPVAAARLAARANVPVYTVALGTAEGTITVPKRSGGTVTKRVPPDPASLAQIARASGGKSFTAQTATGLGEVYKRLGSQLGHRREKRQITQAFAGGAALLLMLGGALSLGWFGRPA